jgi:hypothetical protein
MHAPAARRTLPVALAVMITNILAGPLTPDAGAQAANRTAFAGGAITLNETGQLRRTGSHGLTLNEQGDASGTIPGTIYIHLNLTSPSKVSAEVNIYPSDGSLSGYASATYHVLGAYASFSGSISITRGTGHYAHAHATDLRFTGTIKRVNDATAVQLSGKLFF